MGPNMYLYEKAREAHYQDLLREAEKRRRLSQLPRYRRSMSRRTAVCLSAGKQCEVRSDMRADGH